MRLDMIGVRVLVEKFEECYDFYTKKLGFELFWGERSGPYAAFRYGEYDEPCFAMFRAKNMSLYNGYEPPKASGHSDTVVHVIPSDDVDEDYKRLKKNGVLFMGEPQTIEEWSMRCVYFRDPEGNLFELCEETE